MLRYAQQEPNQGGAKQAGLAMLMKIFEAMGQESPDTSSAPEGDPQSHIETGSNVNPIAAVLSSIWKWYSGGA